MKYPELPIPLQTALAKQGTYEENKTQLENAVWAQAALHSAGWGAGSKSSSTYHPNGFVIIEVPQEIIWLVKKDEHAQEQ